MSYACLLELFELFLRKNKCYDAYVSNVVSIYITVSRCKDNPSNILNTSFNWSHSREGFSYWNNMDIRWRQLIEHIL